MRLEGLRQLENPKTSSGIEPTTLKACSLVPQPYYSVPPALL
jgi:hypothetical protein